MSMNGSTSSLVSGGSAGRLVASPVRILHNAPPPEQWTLVRELNMERREPCEIWRSGVNHQLLKMKEQLTSCSNGIQRLETDLAQDRQTILHHRQLSEQSSELTDHSCGSLRTE